MLPQNPPLPASAAPAPCLRWLGGGGGANHSSLVVAVVVVASFKSINRLTGRDQPLGNMRVDLARHRLRTPLFPHLACLDQRSHLVYGVYSSALSPGVWCILISALTWCIVYSVWCILISALTWCIVYSEWCILIWCHLMFTRAQAVNGRF
jgi:hypothetical protein